MSWDAGTKEQTLIVQTEFLDGEPAKDFALVIPTPTRPDLGTAPIQFFDDLMAFTALTPVACETDREP